MSEIKELRAFLDRHYKSGNTRIIVDRVLDRFEQERREYKIGKIIINGVEIEMEKASIENITPEMRKDAADFIRASKEQLQIVFKDGVKIE